jgi:hypothetical protein
MEAAMKPVLHPPDAVIRAYGDLLQHVFIYVRFRSSEINSQELFDLADAMHNVASIITDYGDWTDDERYRELYLRPFDAKWGAQSIRLEEVLESRLRLYLSEDAG